MGSGWHEWPLMIFTVFGQCVAGGFIVLALALLKGDLRAEAQQRVIACMFGLWVLMGIGFIASMLHLGSPMRAFNSLNRVGLQHSVTKSPAVRSFCCWWHRLVTGNAEKAVTGIAYAVAGGDDGSWRHLCLDDGACV